MHGTVVMYNSLITYIALHLTYICYVANFQYNLVSNFPASPYRLHFITRHLVYSEQFKIIM